MKIIILLIVSLSVLYVHGQVGIKTQNPKGALHIDGAANNPQSGTIQEAQKKESSKAAPEFARTS